MSKEPLMFRSGEKKRKFNWRVLAIFIAFFLIIGAVKIFGLQNLTGHLLMDSSWSEVAIPEVFENSTIFVKPNYSYEGGSKSNPTSNSFEIVGTVPGIVVLTPSPGPPIPVRPTYTNGTWTTVGIYYNRTMPRSDSYQIVPVPNAKIELSNSCENFTPKTSNSSGLVDVFHPYEDTIFTVIAPGFLTNKHSRKTIGNETKSVHFFLTISKSKVSMQSHDRFVMGRASNTTFSIQTMLPDTVLEDHKEITNTTIDAVLIKEINEKIYELSSHFQKKVNLTEGTQQVSLDITVPGNMNGRDLYLPKLQIKLLTSTNDIIHKKDEKISIGFLEASLNNSTLMLTNPTGRTIQGVLISSEVFNERGEKLNLIFSENNLELGPSSSKNITLEIDKGQGNYEGRITITGTLLAAASWDDPASDSISLIFSKKFPVHDVSIKARTAPIISSLETEIETLLENQESFAENVTVLLSSDNYSINETVALKPFESKTHMLKFDTSNISRGVRSFTLSAQIEEDYKPADNQHNISIFVSQNASPKNIVMLIFDGLGYPYLNDELTPNIAGYQYRGFTSTNMRVRIPSTTYSHSILFTSQYKNNWDWRAYAHSVSLPNNTIFDSARSQGYNIFGVMGQGDSSEVVGKMDVMLHDPYNNWDIFSSTLTINRNISEKIQNVFREHNNLSDYQGRSSSVYVDYDQWTADAISTILRTLANESEPFLFVSNFPGTDHAGHSGPADYWETVAAVDLQAKQVLDTLLGTGLIENTLLIITADHGMCFREGSYGEYGYHASCFTDESMAIPFIVLGPNITTGFSDSLSYNDDVTPTLEAFLSFSKQEGSTGRVLKEMFSELNDTGIKAMSTPPLIPGSETTTTVLVKNYGNFETSSTLCFNSTYQETCEQVSFFPKQEKLLNFSWKPEDSDVYKLNAKLLELDNNPHNNLAEQNSPAGIIHDLSIGDTWHSPTSEFYDTNTKKILLTVEVCNRGTLKFDDKVEMHIWTSNCSESWCNKTYNKAFSASPENCNKYKSELHFGLKTGLQTIHFQILNSSDMDLKNDYAGFTTYLPEVESDSSLESVHDLGISNITIEQDADNPLKTKIKVIIKNYGGFEETGLELLGTFDDEEKEYGPYSSKIKTQLTKTFSKTFSELGEHKVSFEITSYSAFDVDVEKANNIKTITFNLEDNG